MPSIKDSTYKLPYIEPLQMHKTFESSANKPLLIRGIDIDTHLKSDYVMKLMKAERMSTDAAMRELLAAFIAMELDLPVTQPAIVNVSDSFVDLLSGNSVYAIAKQSIGYNFSTKYVDRFMPFAIHQPLPNTLLDIAREIFAFDVFIQNADRSHEVPKKPNILTNGKELLIFDHELAFGFVLLLPSLRNQEPWKIVESDKLWIEKHCLYRSLKGKEFEGQNLINNFGKLDSDFWTRASDLIPDTWKNRQQFDLIKTFLSQIVANKEVFIKNLQLLLV